MKINYPAVLVAAIAHFIIGGLWYGLIFGNKFVELIGWSPEKLREMESHNPTKEMIVAFISGLVLVYLLAHFIHYTGARTAMDGLQTAFWLWLGFIATTQIATVVFEERKLGLYNKYWLPIRRLRCCGSDFGCLAASRSERVRASAGVMTLFVQT